jgi:hypothetical protein
MNRLVGFLSDHAQHLLHGVLLATVFMSTGGGEWRNVGHSRLTKR